MDKTHRLFDIRPYDREFRAGLLNQISRGDHWEVILDQTLFYPNSGGQPCDRGTLDGIAVYDVTEQGQTILHHLKQPVPETSSVKGIIDWNRRFDHMQQHTGQHILSQTVRRNWNVGTVGFHLGDGLSTLDLDADLNEEILGQAEYHANRVIWENRPVHCRMISPDEMDRVPWRRQPAPHDTLRVVEVENYDFAACCGTHVSRTGEIGLLKIVRKIRYKGGSRLSFLCGNRALTDYRHCRSVVENLVRQWTCGEEELITVCERRQEDRKAEQRELARWRKECLDLEAQRLIEKARESGTGKVIAKSFSNREPEEVLDLLKRVIHRAEVVMAAGLMTDTYFLFLGRSESLDLDLRALVDPLRLELQGRGGGSSSLIRIQGKKPDREEDFFRNLKEQIESRTA